MVSTAGHFVLSSKKHILNTAGHFVVSSKKHTLDMYVFSRCSTQNSVHFTRTTTTKSVEKKRQMPFIVC